jgi:hypothetical protein
VVALILPAASIIVRNSDLADIQLGFVDLDQAAQHLNHQRQEILLRFREWVRADERLPTRRLSLTNAEIEDHLPDLLDYIEKILRGEESLYAQSKVLVACNS